MEIAGVEIEESCVNRFEYTGEEEEHIKNISMNGTKRDNVLLNRSYNYTIGIIGLKKVDAELLRTAMITLSNTYTKITIDVVGIIRANILGYTFLTIPSTIDFEFDITRVTFENAGGYYNISIPVKQVVYY